MIRGLWTRETVGWLVLAALLPPAAILVVEQGAPGVGRLVAALAAAGAWQLVFRIWHGVPLSPTPAVLAVALAVLAPAALGPGEIALGASFGIVLAELVFGGWGRNIVAAPTAGLAMLYLSFPGGTPPPAEATMAVAAGLAALLLLATGILSLTILATSLGAALATAWALGAPMENVHLAGAVAFALVFLLGDPVAAPTTGAARLVYGLLGGTMIALLAGAGGLEGAARAAVFASLVAQIFAPALDHLGIAWMRLMRERRHV